MRLLLIFAFLLSCIGCGNHLPESLGPARKLIVIADPGDWQTIEKPMREIFEKTLYTPQEERLFEVQRGDVEYFHEHKHALRKSLMVIAPLDANHATAQFLKAMLSPDVQRSILEGKAAVTWKEDVWAKDQMLLVVSGTSIDSLIDNLWISSDRLYSAMERSVENSLKDRVYSFGERESVTHSLAREHGWSVRVPFGYRILESYPDSGFVVLAKDNPNRWLSVYWESNVHPDQLTDDWCIEKRDKITQRFFGGDRISLGDVKVHQTEFVGKLAYVMQGLWENEKEWKGGPFKSYAFTDLKQNRFYFIDMGMYAPNKQKLPYLRQVDFIARTFQIHPELSPQ